MDYMEELKKFKVLEYCNEHHFERVSLYDYDHASNEYWVEFLHHPQRYHRKVGMEKLRPIPDPEQGLVLPRYSTVDVERDTGFFTGTVINVWHNEVEVLQFAGPDIERKEWFPAASPRLRRYREFQWGIGWAPIQELEVELEEY